MERSVLSIQTASLEGMLNNHLHCVLQNSINVDTCRESRLFSFSVAWFKMDIRFCLPFPRERTCGCISKSVPQNTIHAKKICCKMKL